MIDIEALKARNPIEQVVGSFVKLVREGRNYRGPCPVHGGDGQNLVVYPESGTWHCFSRNCDDEGNDVVAFIQQMQGVDFKGACEYLGANGEWKPQLVKPPRPPLPDRQTAKPPEGNEPKSFRHGKLGEPEAVRRLCDLDGALLGFEVRYPRGSDPDEPEKSPSRMWTWGSRDGKEWGWAMGAFCRLRPLYGLDRINGKPQILIHEGPKKADAGAKLLPAAASISWTGGADAWKHHDLHPLAGHNCIIWPDNDAKGLACARALAEVLSNPSGLLHCTVGLLIDESKPPAWDAADALEEGWTPEQAYEWAKAHKIPVIPKATYIDDNSTESSAAQSPSLSEPGSSLPVSSETAPALAPITAPGDEQEPPDMGIPPPDGSTPQRPKSRRGKPDLSLVNGNTAKKPEIQDDPDLPTALTENGSAARFAALHKDDFRVVHEWGGKHGATWLAWDGGCWKREPTRVTAMQRAKTFCAALEYQPEAQFLTRPTKDKFNQKRYITAVLDLAQYDAKIIAPGQQFDADPLMLGTPEGTVDLRIGKLLEAQREHYITRQTAVPPLARPHPLFDSVIECIAKGDSTIRHYIWKALGYSLTGDQREENFWFLYGKPQSGKTTLIEAIAAIMGPAQDGGYATICDMDLFTEARADKGNERLAELAGARFVYASETEEGRNWKAALLKLAVGGDTLRGRMLYENAFTFRPTHHIWIFGNSRPHLKARDEGIKRRLHLIEYPGVISNEERDNTLKMRMVEEYPAILHSMIQGCIDWQNEGLGKPEAVEVAVDKYLQAEDTLQSWIDDFCEINPNEKTQTSAAYTSYRHWAQSGGEYILSQKRFVAMLDERGFERMKYGGTRYLRGFKLRESEHDRKPPPLYSD